MWRLLVAEVETVVTTSPCETDVHFAFLPVAGEMRALAMNVGS